MGEGGGKGHGVFGRSESDFYGMISVENRSEEIDCRHIELYRNVPVKSAFSVVRRGTGARQPGRGHDGRIVSVRLIFDI